MSTIFFFDTWHEYTVLIHRGKEIEKKKTISLIWIFGVCRDVNSPSMVG